MPKKYRAARRNENEPPMFGEHFACVATHFQVVGLGETDNGI